MASQGALRTLDRLDAWTTSVPSPNRSGRARAGRSRRRRGIPRPGNEHGSVPDPRELLSSYRELLQGVRRGAGPAGALLAPM